MSKLCIIPARGRSKRIPGKHIKNLLGKLIIADSTAAATESRLFDEIMVSNDDVAIAGITPNTEQKFPLCVAKSPLVR